MWRKCHSDRQWPQIGGTLPVSPCSVLAMRPGPEHTGGWEKQGEHGILATLNNRDAILH